MSFGKRSSNDTVQGLLMIAPNTLGLLAFYIFPILISINLGLFEWNGLANPKWVGLLNFKSILNDEFFFSSLKNTFLYTIAVVPLILLLTVLSGLLLTREKKDHSKLLFLYLLPLMVIPAAASLIWKWMLNFDYGLINNILSFFYIERVQWLTSPNSILWSIIFIGIWLGFSFNLVIVISGLKGIPSSFYEAAKIDGASSIQQFFKITLPLLTPTLFFILVTQLISCFQVFDSAFIILGSAPSGVLKKAASTLVISIYENGFIYFKMGYSAAQAFILFLIVLIITILQFKGQKKWVHYS